MKKNPSFLTWAKSIFSMFKFPDSSHNEYMTVWCQLKLAVRESSS